MDVVGNEEETIQGPELFADVQELDHSERDVRNALKAALGNGCVGLDEVHAKSDHRPPSQLVVNARCHLLEEEVIFKVLSYFVVLEVFNQKLNIRNAPLLGLVRHKWLLRLQLFSRCSIKMVLRKVRKKEYYFNGRILE